MEQDLKIISGECRYKVHAKRGDPCFGCGFCTIDGNDYSNIGSGEKPF